MRIFTALSDNSQKRDEAERANSINTTSSTRAKTRIISSLYVETKWSPASIDHPLFSASNVQLEDMVSEVDRNIKIALNECARRAEILRSDGSGKALSAEGEKRRRRVCNPRPPLHLLYSRMLSCVVLPVSSSMWESGDWESSDFKLLRERCSRCGTYERVTEQQHRTAIEYLASDEGKGALMAGLNARLELINKHPFYNQQAFDQSKGSDFEAWKLSELEVIEKQKASLMAYTKRELHLDILECRQSGSSHKADAADPPESAPPSHDSSEALPPADGGMDEPLVPGSASPAAASTWFGGSKKYAGTPGSSKFSSMFKSPVSMMVAPVASMARGVVATTVATTEATISATSTVARGMVATTEAVVTGKMAENMIGRPDLWCVARFGPHSFTSDTVSDVGGDQAAKWDGEATVWPMKSDEGGGPVCIELWRRKKFSMRKSEELVGSVMCSWADVEQSAAVCSPLEGWFLVTDAQGHDSGRELRVRLQLVTTHIDGADEEPLFDPKEDMHRVYSEVFRAVNGTDLGSAAISADAVDWLLSQLRGRCGVGDAWNHLLVLAPGLNLATPNGLSHAATLEERERRLQRLVDAVSAPPSLRAATTREQDAIAGALLLIQAQARNELVRFPYRLARGDDCHEEPVELRLLMLLHEAVRRRLLQAQEEAQGGEDDPFADAQGDGGAGEDRADRRAAARTEEVVAAGVERLMVVGYGEALARVLAKDGRQLEAGGVKLSGHDLKRMCKQCGILARGFVNGFAGVLSDEPLRAGLARLADLITFDVVSIMAAYHLRTVERGRLDSGAFEDGSEEQMLLKLHRRANELRRTLTDMWPGMELGGLAGATAPVLKAWVDKMARSIGSWIDAATAQETWMPAIHGTHHSVSLVDAFASAQQAAQTFAALRMGSQASVRTAFLELLGEVCTRYIFIMREAASREHAARATALAAAAGGGSADRGGGRGWLLSVNAFKDDWKAMKNIIFEREGGLDESLDGSRAGDGQDEGSWGVDGLVGKMEHMADELTNVSKWGSNLKSLGRKSMSVSLSLGKKSLNVVTLGAVASPGSLPANPGGRAGGACRDVAEIVVTPSDLYDGTLLVSEAGCTRISNASQVRQQMDAMVSILEQADKEDAAEAAGITGGGDVFLSNDWTLSPQLSAIYDRINTAVSDLVELELRPLLRQAAAAIHASLKDHAGALPPAEHGTGAVSPGVGALLEVLDTNLPVLRSRLDDRNFSLCLRVVWLNALDALQSELHDTSLDISDRVRHPRAAHVLRHLTTSIYADGAGLPLTLIHKSSASLVDILGPAASPPLQPS